MKGDSAAVDCLCVVLWCEGEVMTLQGDTLPGLPSSQQGSQGTIGPQGMLTPSLLPYSLQ